MRDNKLYIGVTNNLDRRLKQHNEKKNESTKNRTPFKVIYYEAYLSKDDAYDREKKLKGFKNSYTQLKKRISNSLKEG